MDDKLLRLLIELHGPNDRQGPGGEAQTLLAASLAGLEASQPLCIADIGCGTGAAALTLAAAFDAQVTAVDLQQTFLDRLRQRAEAAGLGRRIRTLKASMEDLPLAPDSFDVLWSEGAIYNMGFARGIERWRPFLKPGGKLVVSEITWLTDSRPAELESWWLAQYPGMATASTNLGHLERQGYRPEGYFVLPMSCWLENYYRPLQKRFMAFLEAHAGDADAEGLIAAERAEIELYERHHESFGYGVYCATRFQA